MDNNSHHVPSLGSYLGVFGALMFFTAITVGAATLDLGVFNLPIALAIAGTKAALVMWIFMELRHAPRLTRLTAMTGVAFLAILLILTFGDYVGRTMPLPSDPAWLPKSTSIPAAPAHGAEPSH
ncbi:MAG: cytochrome C oxidase subunit IV family protein [Bryobacteraceae bacterium]